MFKWGGKIKYILIACFLGNICAKQCRNRTVYVKITASCKGGTFLRYSVDAEEVLPNINRTQAAERAENNVFVPGDLDLPNEGLNTSSVWIWLKSVQRFLKYFIHKQKTQTGGARNRTYRNSLRAVKSSATAAGPREALLVEICVNCCTIARNIAVMKAYAIGAWSWKSFKVIVNDAIRIGHVSVPAMYHFLWAVSRVRCRTVSEILPLLQCIRDCPWPWEVLQFR